MPPLAVDPPSTNDSPVMAGNRGRTRARRNSFDSTPSDSQLKVRRSKTEGDLEVDKHSDGEDPISPKSRSSLSPGRFLSKRWSRAKTSRTDKKNNRNSSKDNRGETDDEEPSSSTSPGPRGRRFNRRNKAKAATDAGGEDAAAHKAASKSLSPGRRKGGSIFKSLKALLASPNSTRPDRRKIISAANNRDTAVEDKDSPLATNTSTRRVDSSNFGPLPFMDTDDEGGTEGIDQQQKRRSHNSKSKGGVAGEYRSSLLAQNEEGKQRTTASRSETNAPTSEITIPNLDAWDSDDDETDNKSDLGNWSSAKSSPASPITRKRANAMKGNSATPVTKNTRKAGKGGGWEVPLAKYRDEEKEEIQPPKPANLQNSWSSNPSVSSFKVRVSQPGTKAPLPSSLSRFEKQRSEPSFDAKKTPASGVNKNHSSLNELSPMGRRKKVEFGNLPSTLTAERKKEVVQSKIQNAKNKANKSTSAKNQLRQRQFTSSAAALSKTTKQSGKPTPRKQSLSPRSTIRKTPAPTKVNPNPKKTKKVPPKSRAPPPPPGSGWNRPLHEQSDDDDEDIAGSKVQARTVRPRSYRETRKSKTSMKNVASQHNNSAPALKTDNFENSILFPDPAIDFKAKFDEEEEPEEPNTDPHGRSWRSPLPKPAVKKAEKSTKETPPPPPTNDARRASSPFLRNNSKAFRDRETALLHSSAPRLSGASQDSFGPFPDPPMEWPDANRAAHTEGETVEELNKEIDNLMGETVELRDQLSAAWDRIALLTKSDDARDPPQEPGELQESGGCMADDERSGGSSTDLFASGQGLDAPSCDLTEADDIITKKGDETEPHEDDPVEPEAVEEDANKAGLGHLIYDTKLLRQELEAANGKFDALSNMHEEARLQVQRSNSARPPTASMDARRDALKRSNSGPGPFVSPISMIIDMSNSDGRLGGNPSTKSNVTMSTSPNSRDSSGDEQERTSDPLSRGNTEHDTLYASYGSFSLKYEDDDDDEDEEMDQAETNKAPPSTPEKVRAHIDLKVETPTTVKSRDELDEGLAKQQHDLAQQLEAWRMELEEKEDRLSEEMQGVKGKNKDIQKRQEEMDAMFEDWKRKLDSQEEQLKEAELKAKRDNEECSRVQNELDKSIKDRILEQNDMRRKISRVTRLHMELNLSMKNKMAKIAVLVRDLSKVTGKLEVMTKDNQPITPELKTELRMIQNRIMKQVNELDKEDLQIELERGNLSSGSLGSAAALHQQTQGLKKETDRLLDKLKQKQSLKVGSRASNLASRMSSSLSSLDTRGVDYDLLLKEVKTLREENKSLRSDAGSTPSEVERIKKRDVFVADMQAEVESLLRELNAKAAAAPSPTFAREQLVLNSLNRALVVKLAMEPNIDSEDTKKRSAAIRSMKREIEKLRKELMEAEPEADARPTGAEEKDENSGPAPPPTTNTWISPLVEGEQPLPPVNEDESLHVGLSRSAFLNED